jgi:transcriptional regulator with XRE-family HTH domain
MSPAALIAIERGTSSPTLATLHKILKALGTDYSQFFATDAAPEDALVFAPDTMRPIRDQSRLYRLLFPPCRDIKFQMVMETLAPIEKETEWEAHDCDMGGVVLSKGQLRLEIDGAKLWTLRQGFAFYIKAWQRHRARNCGRHPLQLLTVWHPPRY